MRGRVYCRNRKKVERSPLIRYALFRDSWALIYSVDRDAAADELGLPAHAIIHALHGIVARHCIDLLRDRGRKGEGILISNGKGGGLGYLCSQHFSG